MLPRPRVVRLNVCLSHSCTLLKLVDLNEMPFGKDTCVVPSNIVLNRYSGGLTENDGHENYGPSKLQDMKMQDMKLTDQVAGHEIAGHEIAGQKREKVPIHTPTYHTVINFYFSVCSSRH